MAIIVPIVSTFNDQGLKRAVREFTTAKTTLGKFGAVGKVFDGVGKNLTKNVTVPLLAIGGALAVAAKGAEQAEIANRKLGSVLNSMGFGEATQRVSDYAEQLERNLAVDADIIKATQTKLATFKNLTATVNETNGAFDRATMAALDLAAAGFGEAETNAVQLGKALQDPVKGITALSRSGVTFTNQEKEKIKTLVESNNILAAQELILSAIETQVGGTAAAGASSFERIKLSLMQVADEIGLAVLPLIDQLADNISTLIPIITAKIKNFTDAWKNLGPEVQKNILIGIGLIAVLGPLFIVIGKVIAAVKAFIVVFKILSIALLTNPIYLVIAGITLLVVALVRAFQTSNTFRQGIAKLGNIFIWFAEQALNYVIGYLNLWLKGINLILRGLRVLGLDVKEIGEIAPIAIKRLSFATVEAGKDVAELSDETAGLGTTLAKDLNPNLESTNDELDKTTDKATKTKDALKKMKDQAKEAAQIIVDKLEESLRSAESQLDNAKNAFENFKNSIKGVVTGILNFGKASEEGSFIENITAQAAQATLFADKVRKLITSGLSERALQQVLDAGFEAGSKIADEIIAGGSTMVQQVNALVESVDFIANEVGTFGAETFYQAGVTQGEALVAGIKAALEAARSQLKSIVDSLSTGQASDSTAPVPPSPTPKPKPKQQVFTGTNLNVPAGGVMGFGPKPKPFDFGFRANGGPVTGGFPFVVGERGPELFIPNTSGSITPNNRMADSKSTINITVNAGLGTNGAQVGREIVDAIKRYERSSGPVFASA